MVIHHCSESLPAEYGSVSRFEGSALVQIISCFLLVSGKKYFLLILIVSDPFLFARTSGLTAVYCEGRIFSTYGR